MKTPEKIKLGLRLCTLQTADCKGCPYLHEGSLCRERLATDLMGYTCEIESTVSQVKKALSDNGFLSLQAFLQSYNQVKAERDAAIKDIPRACGYCKHYVHSKTHLCRSKKPCANISGINTAWEWRGVREENSGEADKPCT